MITYEEVRSGYTQCISTRTYSGSVGRAALRVPTVAVMIIVMVSCQEQLLVADMPSRQALSYCSWSRYRLSPIHTPDPFLMQQDLRKENKEQKRGTKLPLGAFAVIRSSTVRKVTTSVSQWQFVTVACQPDPAQGTGNWFVLSCHSHSLRARIR